MPFQLLDALFVLDQQENGLAIGKRQGAQAREAGRRGGETVSQDREHMSEIGKLGGGARGRNNQ